MIDNQEFTDEQIAQVAHDLHVAFQNAMADQLHPTWRELAPDAWQRDATFQQIARIRQNPTLTAEAEHEAWRKERMALGWTYGETRDVEAKTSPILVPWAELPRQYRVKSQVGIDLIRAMIEAV